MKRTPLQRKTPMPRQRAGIRRTAALDTLAAVTTPKARKPLKSRSTPKMTPARKSAKGRPCLVRLPGCDGGGETTVLAHYRLAGHCGTGLKPPDVLGAFCCGPCHDACDGRRTLEGWSKTEIRLAHAEGCLRTAALLETESSP